MLFLFIKIVKKIYCETFYLENANNSSLKKHTRYFSIIHEAYSLLI